MRKKFETITSVKPTIDKIFGDQDKVSEHVVDSSRQSEKNLKKKKFVELQIQISEKISNDQAAISSRNQ